MCLLTIFSEMVRADSEVMDPSDFVRAAFHNSYRGGEGTSALSMPDDSALDFLSRSSSNEYPPRDNRWGASFNFWRSW